jgi:hypothetical protein
MLETRMGGVRDIVQDIGLPHVLCFQARLWHVLSAALHLCICSITCECTPPAGTTLTCVLSRAWVRARPSHV